MPKPPERIAVVGWGSLSPLGSNADATWRAVLSGASGISSLTQDWAADLPSRIAGCVDEGGLSDLEPLLRRRSDRCAQLAVMAARQTWRMAADQRAGVDQQRVAVVVGTGIGGLGTMHVQHQQLEWRAIAVNPLTVPMLIPDGPAGQVAIDLLHGGTTPPRLYLSTTLMLPDAADDERPCSPVARWPVTVLAWWIFAMQPVRRNEDRIRRSSRWPIGWLVLQMVSMLAMRIHAGSTTTGLILAAAASDAHRRGPSRKACRSQVR